MQTVGAKQSAHVTVMLNNLHWLGIKERTIASLQPISAKLLFHNTPQHLLPSSSSNLLSVLKTKMAYYVRRQIFLGYRTKALKDLPNFTTQCSVVDCFESRKKKSPIFKKAFFRVGCLCTGTTVKSIETSM